MKKATTEGGIDYQATQKLPGKSQGSNIFEDKPQSHSKSNNYFDDISDFSFEWSNDASVNHNAVCITLTILKGGTKEAA